MWGKIVKDRRLLDDFVYEVESNDTRTHMIFDGLDKICYSLNLGTPIWLESNIQDLKKTKKTRFIQDSFIENIDFDYLEILIIEE